jgi:broad specificity phosphatase PhoE
MIQAIFIRHAQSEANVGLPTADFAQVPLTELGLEQARALADTWPFTPSRIILSPYLRTRQTAAPMLARYPQVPIETWDIHEFTLWDPAAWGGSEPRDVMEAVARYWSDADPEHRQAGHAESFAELLRRAESALSRLEAMHAAAPVLLFTHGHFIQALRLTVLYPQWTDRQKMQEFMAFDDAQRVHNTQCVSAEFDGRLWRVD